MGLKRADVRVRHGWLIGAVVLAFLTVSGAQAHEARQGAATWELTGLTSQVQRLFVPASGALLAGSDGKLRRSDDGGASWRDIALPPGADLAFIPPGDYTPKPVAQGRVAVDPTNHDTLYVGSDVLNKSVDGGATWSPLPVEGRPLVVAVSPADPNIVQTMVSRDDGYHRLRSRDGGMSWEPVAPLAETLPDGRRSPFSYAVYLLQLHPTDSNRVFLAAGGTSGRSTAVSLYDGYDGTGTRPSPALAYDPGYFIDAERLVGGAGAAPGRFYAVFNHRVTPYSQATTTKLVRIEQGGPSTVIFETDGGGGLNGRSIGDELPSPVFVDALAYDPTSPDRVYAGVNEYQAIATGSSYPTSLALTRKRSYVMASTDGGASWSTLGQQDIGAEIHHLALGVDRANLYLGTEAGLYRLGLAAAGR